MKISVIIPTYNESENLPNLLECLSKQTLRDFEIVIADNNSTDKTRNIAKKYGAKICDGGLPARGRNQGAKHSQGEVLFFLDADVLCGAEFLEKNLTSFQEQGLDFAMPRLTTSSSDLSFFLYPHS
jgi:glycosyltransferase involved in cell wall biosynthesis